MARTFIIADLAAMHGAGMENIRYILDQRLVPKCWGKITHNGRGREREIPAKIAVLIGVVLSFQALGLQREGIRTILRDAKLRRFPPMSADNLHVTAGDGTLQLTVDVKRIRERLGVDHA